MEHNNYNDLMKNLPKLNDKKLTIIGLSVIFSLGILIRIYYFPHDIPIVLDGLTYFWYANDISILNTFPLGYNFPNNGWSIFLSIFFNIINSENFLDYMNMQRAISIIFSSLTAIPVYLLCTKFFDKKIALLGALMFVVDPRIILNSLLGITEPAFIFLGTLTLFLFLSKNKKIVYLSFVTLALFTLVRYEGLLLLIPLSVMFFIKFRKEKLVFANYFIAIGIFLVIITPVMYVNTTTMGEDGIFSHVIAGPKYVEKLAVQDSVNNDKQISNFFINAPENLLKYLIWISIPTFIVFIPYGIVKIFQKRNFNKSVLIVSSFFLLLPGLYAYGREIPDPRYLFILLPIFSIISLYLVEKILHKTNRKNMILILISILIIISSLVFIEFKKPDYQHQQEAFQIAIHIGKIVNGTNSYYPESAYLIPAKIYEIDFPNLKETVPEQNKIIPTNNYHSLDQYVNEGKEYGLTHLVIDDRLQADSHMNNFLIEVFSEEKEIPYLQKIFDSRNHGFNYHVKVFEINYDKFQMN